MTSPPPPGPGSTADSKAPFGRCISPRCTERWAVGEPRPIPPPPAVGRQDLKYCSGECGNDARNARKKARRQRIDGTLARAVELESGLSAPLRELLETYHEVRDRLLVANRELEAEAEAERQAREQADRQAIEADLAATAAGRRADEAESARVRAERAAARAVDGAESAQEEQRAAEQRAALAQQRAEGADEARKRTEAQLSEVLSRAAAERQQAADALTDLQHRLHQQGQELTAEREISAGLRADLATATARAETDGRRLDELRAELDQRQAEHARERNRLLTEHARERDRLTAERDQAAAALATERTCAEGLRGQLAEARTEARIAETQAADLRERVEDLREQTADLRNRLDAAAVDLPEVVEVDRGVLGVALPNGGGVLLQGEQLSLSLPAGQRHLDDDSAQALAGALLAVAAYRTRHR